MTKPKWYDGWHYVVYLQTDTTQYKCIFTLPNAANGMTEYVITDPSIAALLMSAFDQITKSEKHG